jgi:hypothetical protein
MDQASFMSIVFKAVIIVGLTHMSQFITRGHQILVTLAKFSKSGYYILHGCPSGCLSVSPHGTTLRPLDGVTLNFKFVYFSKPI